MCRTPVDWHNLIPVEEVGSDDGTVLGDQEDEGVPLLIPTVEAVPEVIPNHDLAFDWSVQGGSTTFQVYGPNLQVYNFPNDHLCAFRLALWAETRNNDVLDGGFDLVSAMALLYGEGEHPNPQFTMIYPSMAAIYELVPGHIVGLYPGNGTGSYTATSIGVYYVAVNTGPNSMFHVQIVYENDPLEALNNRVGWRQPQPRQYVGAEPYVRGGIVHFESLGDSTFRFSPPLKGDDKCVIFSFLSYLLPLTGLYSHFANVICTTNLSEYNKMLRIFLEQTRLKWIEMGFRGSVFEKLQKGQSIFDLTTTVFPESTELLYQNYLGNIGDGPIGLKMVQARGQAGHAVVDLKILNFDRNLLFEGALAIHREAMTRFLPYRFDFNPKMSYNDYVSRENAPGYYLKPLPEEEKGEDDPADFPMLDFCGGDKLTKQCADIFETYSGVITVSNRDAPVVKREVIEVEMPICRYFVQGECRSGNNCRFAHPTPPEREEGEEEDEEDENFDESGQSRRSYNTRYKADSHVSREKSIYTAIDKPKPETDTLTAFIDEIGNRPLYLDFLCDTKFTYVSETKKGNQTLQIEVEETATGSALLKTGHGRIYKIERYQGQDVTHAHQLNAVTWLYAKQDGNNLVVKDSKERLRDFMIQYIKSDRPETERVLAAPINTTDHLIRVAKFKWKTISVTRQEILQLEKSYIRESENLNFAQLDEDAAKIVREDHFRLNLTGPAEVEKELYRNEVHRIFTPRDYLTFGGCLVSVGIGLYRLTRRFLNFKLTRKSTVGEVIGKGLELKRIADAPKVIADIENKVELVLKNFEAHLKSPAAVVIGITDAIGNKPAAGWLSNMRHAVKKVEALRRVQEEAYESIIQEKIAQNFSNLASYLLIGAGVVVAASYCLYRYFYGPYSTKTLDKLVKEDKEREDTAQRRLIAQSVRDRLPSSARPRTDIRLSYHTRTRDYTGMYGMPQSEWDNQPNNAMNVPLDKFMGLLPPNNNCRRLTCHMEDGSRISFAAWKKLVADNYVKPNIVKMERVDDRQLGEYGVIMAGNIANAADALIGRQFGTRLYPEGCVETDAKTGRLCKDKPKGVYADFLEDAEPIVRMLVKETAVGKLTVNRYINEQVEPKKRHLYTFGLRKLLAKLSMPEFMEVMQKLHEFQPEKTRLDNAAKPIQSAPRIFSCSWQCQLELTPNCEAVSKLCSRQVA